MRLLISAGGTGGGVYPALAIAQAALKEWGLAGGTSGDDLAPHVLWIGSVGGMEADLVARAGLPFRAIPGAGVHGVGWRLPLNALALARGFLEAHGLVREFAAGRPAAVLVTGGFIAVPVALASWLHGLPILLYLPDIEPGLAAGFIGRLARRVAVTVERSRSYFQAAKVVVTGYPTRPELGAATREQARAHFGLDPGRRTVLVTGGSRGAHSLNRALWGVLPELTTDYQVIHLSGRMDQDEAERARQALPAPQRAFYHPFAYLHEMGLALAAADLAVSRAGASALGEYPLFGLPAILVPYPHAWRYQKVNADYLVERGAAVRVNDEDLADRLLPEVRAVLGDEARLARMRAAARAAATPQAARRIVSELAALAGAPARHGGGAGP